MAPDVAVVVPTRNREVLLGRLLGQLLRLDPALRYELIVVDEGSTDGTPALLEAVARRHPLTVLRHDQPVGLPSARNAGTGAATAPYVAWIDDDDLTAPDRLRRQLEGMRASGRRWSCAGRVDIDDDLRVIGYLDCPPADGLATALLRSNCLPAAAQGLLVERALALEVGGYDPALDAAEDWDFCIRLLDGGPPHLLDEPLVGYRTGVASMSTDTARMERAIAAVFAKHADRLAAAGVRPDWAAVHRSLLPADLAGSRRAAVRRAAKALAAGPSPKAAARLVEVALVPGRAARRSARARVDQVPAGWRAAGERWLSEVPASPLD